MVDVPRLRKELEFITAHRDKWDQSLWVSRCGTYGCLAGNTVIHAGAYYPKKNPGSVMTIARRLLDLNYYEASYIFNPNNTLKDLWHIANKITNREIEIPLEFS